MASTHILALALTVVIVVAANHADAAAIDGDNSGKTDTDPRNPTP
jgi:hypothetical protein